MTLQLNTLQELFLNLGCVLKVFYKMYGFKVFFKKSSQPVNPPYWFMHTKRTAFFSYHDQKLQKFSKYFGENLNRGVNLNRIAVQIISKATV